MRYSSELNLRELDAAEFPSAYAVLRSGVAEAVAPGMVAGVWERKRPDEIWVAALGSRRLALGGLSALPMEPETPFDLASVSKVFATATLAAVLVERRWIRWETPLAAFFPGYPYPEISLAHLLSHTAGFAAWEPFWERVRSAFEPGALWNASIADRQRKMRELMLAVRPEAAPGVRAVYSDICFMLLGFALEEATSLPLDRAVRALVWDPMGIERAWYRHTDAAPATVRDEQVAATEDCPWRKTVLQGQVHDDNTWSMGGYAGHAGAFAGAREVLHFARTLLSGKVLSAETLRSAWTRASVPVGCDRTLGWDTPSGAEPSASSSFSARSVGHLGFTGTSLWIDPAAGIAVTLLTNRVHPSRENTKIRAFRPKFHAALRGDLGY